VSSITASQYMSTEVPEQNRSTSVYPHLRTYRYTISVAPLDYIITKRLYKIKYSVLLVSQHQQITLV